VERSTRGRLGCGERVLVTLFGLAFFMTRRRWDEVGFDDPRGVEWGPVGTWAGAIATVLVVITTALVALGYFDGSGSRTWAPARLGAALAA
jgi:hypothetical protein